MPSFFRSNMPNTSAAAFVKWRRWIFQFAHRPGAAGDDRFVAARASRTAVSADARAVDVHGSGTESGRLVSEGRGQLGGAACGGRLERAERQYGCVLQSAPKIVAGDGQNARPAHRKTARWARAGRMALARTMREIGGRYRDLDARYGGEPGVVSAALQPVPRSRLAAGAPGVNAPDRKRV